MYRTSELVTVAVPVSPPSSPPPGRPAPSGVSARVLPSQGLVDGQAVTVSAGDLAQPPAGGRRHGSSPSAPRPSRAT